MSLHSHSQNVNRSPLMGNEGTAGGPQYLIFIIYMKKIAADKFFDLVFGAHLFLTRRKLKKVITATDTGGKVY